MKIFARSLLIIAIFALSMQARNVWTPEMQVKTKAIGTPQISSDDKRVAYTVNDAVMTAEKSEFVTQI